MSRHDQRLAEETPAAGDRHARAAAPRPGHPAVPLQRAIGNRAMSRLVREGVLDRRAAVARLKGKPKKAPFYQEILDARQELKRTGYGRFAVPFFPILESLARALEAGDAAAVKAQCKALMALDAPEVLPYQISEEMANELISRTLLMGLEQESATLRRHFRERERFGGMGWRQYGPDLRMWEKALELARAEPPRTKKEALAGLDVLLRAFAAIFKEAGSLEESKVRSDRQMRSSFDLVGPRSESISAYQDDLLDMLRQLYVAIQGSYELILDAAIGDLEAGRKGADEALAEARRVLEQRIKPAVFAEIKQTMPKGEPVVNSPRGVVVDVTRSTFSKRGNRYLDVFLEGKAARERSIGFSFYDVTQEEAPEKQLTMERIHWIRVEQLNFLERLYGLKTDKSGRADPEAAENAAVIKKLGGRLRLHSDDDWRKFLLEKLKAVRARTKDDGEALSQVIDLLKAYLGAFTIHTPYNIDDFGDNYLTKTFPRALTGQLLHDCGVYALRIAYALSLVRNELKLRFRFILLPAHVGLVITGDRLPMFIAHNNSIERVTPQDLAGFQKEWQSRDPTGKRLATPRPLDETQFLGEFAAGYFLPFVDMPFRFVEGPRFRKDTKEEYWSFYKDKLRQNVLKPGKGEVEQFHLRYLDQLDQYKAIYNEKVRRFWNVEGRAVWGRHQASVLKALEQLRKGGSADQRKTAREGYEQAIKAYRKDLEKAYEPVDKAMAEWHRKAGETSRAFGSHRELTASGATRGLAARAPVSFPWAADFEAHLAEVDNLKNLTDAQKAARLVPPFAPGTKELGPID